MNKLIIMLVVSIGLSYAHAQKSPGGDKAPVILGGFCTSEVMVNGKCPSLGSPAAGNPGAGAIGGGAGAGAGSGAGGGAGGGASGNNPPSANVSVFSLSYVKIIKLETKILKRGLVYKYQVSDTKGNITAFRLSEDQAKQYSSQLQLEKIIDIFLLCKSSAVKRDGITYLPAGCTVSYVYAHKSKPNYKQLLNLERAVIDNLERVGSGHSLNVKLSRRDGSRLRRAELKLLLPNREYYKYRRFVGSQPVDIKIKCSSAKVIDDGKLIVDSECEVESIDFSR